MYKTLTKFFQRFGKNKRFRLTSPVISPVSSNKDIKTRNSLTGIGKQKDNRSKLWSNQFNSPKPEWLNELYKQFRQYKSLRNKWMQRQGTKNDQIPGDNFEKDLREFDFKSLKELCNKYIDLVDREVRMASTDRLEVKFDKKGKKLNTNFLKLIN